MLVLHKNFSKNTLVFCCFIGLCCSLPANAEEAAVAETPAAAGSAAKTGSASKVPSSKTGSDKKAVEPQMIKLADGKLVLPVPGNWMSAKPRSRILKHEFSISPANGDKQAGRMTIMSAGGGVEANIARWAGQFQTVDGKPLGDDAKKVTKKKMGEVEVHIVDFAGNFQDSMRGPFGPKVNRPDYRMLAAIIPLKKSADGSGGGTWFIKSYGPKATMKANEKGFASMIEGMKIMK